MIFKQTTTSISTDVPSRPLVQDLEARAKSLGAQQAELTSKLEAKREKKRQEFHNPNRGSLMAAPGKPSLDEEIAQLEHEQRFTDFAIQENAQALAVARGKYSVEVTNYPQNYQLYLACENAIADAVRALSAANAAEEAFFAALRAAGISRIPWNSNAVKALGVLSDPNSTAAMALREIAKSLSEASK